LTIASDLARASQQVMWTQFQTGALLVSFAALSLGLSPASAAVRSIPEWAVYIYEGGDYSDLLHPALDDLGEMERVGSSDDLAIVVQRDGAHGTGMRRYLIQKAPATATRRPATRPLETYPPVDSASAPVLAGFVQWALEHYPARHRVLVLAGHSWGWKGVIQDEGNRSIIHIPQAAAAINTGLEKAGASPFDLIVFDSCVTGCVEISHQMQGVARYAVFPPVEDPYHGFPWDTILGRLKSEPHRTPLSVTRAFVKDFIESYAPGGSQHDGHFDPDALIALDLTRMDPLFESVARLGKLLHKAGKSSKDYPEIQEIAGEDKNIDVLEMARLLAHQETGAIRKAALDVQAAVGYPDPDNDTAHRVLTVERANPFELAIEITIDKHLVPDRPATGAPRQTPVPPELRRRPSRAALLSEFCKLNPGWTFNDLHDPEVVLSGSRGVFRFHVTSEASKGSHVVRFRPAVSSSTACRYRVGQEKWTQVTYPERVYRERFEAGSPLVAEAHSNGIYPCYGPRVYFAPKVDRNHVAPGKSLYHKLSWDQWSQWGAFLFDE
jgi:hypothetical protein